MTKSVYEILASKVVDAVEAIKDPVEKAKAIGKFMEILKDKDVRAFTDRYSNSPLGTNDPVNDIAIVFLNVDFFISLPRYFSISFLFCNSFNKLLF